MRADVDLDLAIDVIAGPMIYRIMITGGDIEQIAGQPARGARARDGRASGLADVHAAAVADARACGGPASSSSSSAPTSSRRQPRSVRTSGSGRAAARGDDDRREVGARGDQLVGEPGLLRAGAHERLGERDHRPVDATRSAAARPRRGGPARPPCRARSRRGCPSPRRRTTSGLTPRICASSRRPAGWRLASSTTVGSRSTEPTGRSSRDAVRSRHAASSRATARSRGSRPATRGSRRQTSSGSRSSVASAIARHSSRAHSSRPRPSSRAGDLVGQRQQVLDVAARVAELLLGQRPRVPAREARGLRQPDPQDVVEQAVVARLGGEAREAGRDLRVEHVRERRSATRGAGSRRPGGRRARRSRRRVGEHRRRAARGRSPGAGRAPRPRSPTAIWTRHSSGR